MSICGNRTIIVTGSGSGLGREYALALAAEGANVAVNDIRLEAAEAVVKEIEAAGGKAVAAIGDITSMAGADAIIAAAIARFGNVHGIVNNAGVVRDKMFATMSEDDWDTVIRVHLKGHFCIASKLVQRWRDQVKAGERPEGRIVNTSSGAGLQGNIGQSNYSAAKAGIAALTLVQAAELGRYGVTANALAPAARTGMTEGPFGAMMKAPEDGSFDHYHPGNVAPLVVYLCSTLSAGVSGQVFEVEGGKVSIANGWKTGTVRNKGARWQPVELDSTIRGLIASEPPAQKVYGT